MYAGIRQAKAKSGMAEELTRRIKEGAIPLISDVPGFQAYYVIYAPDDTVTAVSISDNYAAAQESNKRALAWIETELAPLLAGPATAVAGPAIRPRIHRRRRSPRRRRVRRATVGRCRSPRRGVPRCPSPRSTPPRLLRRR